MFVLSKVWGVRAKALWIDSALGQTWLEFGASFSNSPPPAQHARSMLSSECSSWVALLMWHVGKKTWMWSSWTEFYLCLYVSLHALFELLINHPRNRKSSWKKSHVFYYSSNECITDVSELCTRLSLTWIQPWFPQPPTSRLHLWRKAWVLRRWCSLTLAAVQGLRRPPRIQLQS